MPYCGFFAFISLSLGCIVRATRFALYQKQALHHVLKKEGIRSITTPRRGPSSSWHARQILPGRLSISAAMRAKGYLDVEAANQILAQQVRRESQK
jgi:hypothetical protein